MNKDHKLLRAVIKSILGHLSTFDVNNSSQMIDFRDLSIVDKFMMIKLLEFSKKIT